MRSAPHTSRVGTGAFDDVHPRRRELRLPVSTQYRPLLDLRLVTVAPEHKKLWRSTGREMPLNGEGGQRL
jgi:hypothetical protein